MDIEESSQNKQKSQSNSQQGEPLELENKVKINQDEDILVRQEYNKNETILAQSTNEQTNKLLDQNIQNAENNDNKNFEQIKEETNKDQKVEQNLQNTQNYNQAILESEENLNYFKTKYETAIGKKVDIINQNGNWVVKIENQIFSLDFFESYINKIIQSQQNGSQGMVTGNDN